MSKRKKLYKNKNKKKMNNYKMNAYLGHSYKPREKWVEEEEA